MDAGAAVERHYHGSLKPIEAYMKRQTTKIAVPADLAFDALRLTREPDGSVRFDWAVVERICQASGLPLEMFRDACVFHAHSVAHSTGIRPLIPRPFGHPRAGGDAGPRSTRIDPFSKQGVEMERLSMRQIREYLRLRFEGGLSHRQIAASLQGSRSRVGEYERRLGGQ
jgi:hypothetical protein